jgi:outer membrane murein-binding lipoprotein Lpp
MTSFDESLWTRLVAEHDADLLTMETGGQRDAKRPLLLGGSALALAAATAAVVLAAGAASTAPPAYALTRNPDGSVTVTINELSTAAPALNAKFAEMGVDETVVPVEAGCPTTREFRLTAYPQLHMTDQWTFQPDNLQSGWKGVLAAEQLPNGEVAVAQMAIRPPVPSCFSNVADNPPQPTGKTMNGIPMMTQTPVNPAQPGNGVHSTGISP